MNKDMLPSPLRTLLDRSAVHRVKITLDTRPTAFAPSTASKVGGMGYLPVGELYPTTADGVPLVLLFQLNFRQLHDTIDTSQLPHPLPTQGVLQVYIDGTDDLWGMDCEGPAPHSGYQVRFYADDSLPINQDEIERTKAKLLTLSNDVFAPFNVKNEHEMTFLLDKQSCNMGAFEYERFAQDIPELAGQSIWEYLNSTDVADDAWRTYHELANIGHHHLLGYPFFTQSDPREYHTELHEHILLLQIDTDDDNDIMWGDCGVGNFFIHPDDLHRQDFSKLIYNWDCC